jgi:hypothetical protein
MKNRKFKLTVVMCIVAVAVGVAAIYYYTNTPKDSMNSGTEFKGEGGKFRGHGATGTW